MPGLWIEQTEGAKFWLKVMSELKNRGLQGIPIAVVDGLKSFQDAIGAVFPQTTVQTCIVDRIRNSMAFVSWKDRKAMLPALKAVYQAVNADETLELDAFGRDWGAGYPTIAPMWRRSWDNVIPRSLSSRRRFAE